MHAGVHYSSTSTQVSSCGQAHSNQKAVLKATLFSSFELSQTTSGNQSFCIRYL